MGTRVKVTYIAIEVGEGYHKPIMSANTFQDLKAGLDEYYGCNGKGGECLGFTPYETKYPDDYEGYYTYTVTAMDNKIFPQTYTEKVNVYCVEYHPYTVYETTPQTNNTI